ncbi:MAG TPA: cytochrome c [Xanthobacteraceae bacterium]
MTTDLVNAGEGGSLPRFVAGTRGVATAAMFALVAAVLLSASGAVAQDPGFSPTQIRAGAQIFARNCSPCHGPHMRDPESAFDLRKFPHDAHERFVSSVTHGKNQMPPWGDLLQPADVEALWAYVVAGER